MGGGGAARYEWTKKTTGSGQGAFLSIGAPLGNVKGARFTGSYEKQMDCSGNGASLSLCELCKGDLEERLL
jgi:hypothetical protein